MKIEVYIGFIYSILYISYYFNVMDIISMFIFIIEEYMAKYKSTHLILNDDDDDEDLTQSPQWGWYCTFEDTEGI